MQDGTTVACGVSCVELPLVHLRFVASVACAQMVEAYTRGPWTVVTFRHLFVKVIDVHVCSIVQSLVVGVGLTPLPIMVEGADICF